MVEKNLEKEDQKETLDSGARNLRETFSHEAFSLTTNGGLANQSKDLTNSKSGSLDSLPKLSIQGSSGDQTGSAGRASDRTGSAGGGNDQTGSSGHDQTGSTGKPIDQTIPTGKPVDQSNPTGLSKDTPTSNKTPFDINEMPTRVCDGNSKPADSVQRLSTGDTITKEGDKTTLTTPGGDKISLNKDGTYSIKGDVKSVTTDKYGQTTVTFKDGANMTFDKDGFRSVNRENKSEVFGRRTENDLRELMERIRSKKLPQIEVPTNNSSH